MGNCDPVAQTYSNGRRYWPAKRTTKQACVTPLTTTKTLAGPSSHSSQLGRTYTRGIGERPTTSRLHYFLVITALVSTYREGGGGIHHTKGLKWQDPS